MATIPRGVSAEFKAIAIPQRLQVVIEAVFKSPVILYHDRYSIPQINTVIGVTPYAIAAHDVPGSSSEYHNTVCISNVCVSIMMRVVIQDEIVCRAGIHSYPFPLILRRGAIMMNIAVFNDIVIIARSSAENNPALLAVLYFQSLDVPPRAAINRW